MSLPFGALARPNLSLVLSIGAVASAALAHGEVCTKLRMISPNPTVRGFHGVAHGGEVFVAVGSAGSIVGSPAHLGHIVWSEVSAPTDRDLMDVIWTDTAFVAAGDDGVIVSSPDGSQWTARDSGTDRDFTGLASNTSVLVAVTRIAFWYTSTDGHGWEYGGHDWWAHDLRDVEWCGDRFLAVGRQGSQGASHDGHSWWGTGDGGESSPLEAVAFDGSRVIAVGLGGQLVASDNRGASWIQVGAVADVPLRGGVRGNGVSVLVGGNFAWFGAGHILASINNEQWERHLSPVETTLYGLFPTGSGYVVLGDDAVVLRSHCDHLAPPVNQDSW